MQRRSIETSQCEMRWAVAVATLCPKGCDCANTIPELQTKGMAVRGYTVRSESKSLAAITNIEKGEIITIFGQAAVTTENRAVKEVRNMLEVQHQEPAENISPVSVYLSLELHGEGKRCPRTAAGAERAWREGRC